MKRILFKPEMVQAIMQGKKNCTRRAFTAEIDPRITSIIPHQNSDEFFFGRIPLSDELKAVLGGVSGHVRHGIFTPKYKVGEIVGIAETFFALGGWVKSEVDGKAGWTFIEDEIPMYRYLDNPPKTIVTKRDDDYGGYYKRPSLFIPDRAIRTKIEITDVRAEKLLQISEEDAIAEGILEPENGLYYCYLNKKFIHQTAVASYLSLWDKINGKDSHQKNPFVWVYNFKKI